MITFGLEGIALAPVFLWLSVDRLDGNAGQTSFTLENGGSALRIALYSGGMGDLEDEFDHCSTAGGILEKSLQMVCDVHGRVSVCPLSRVSVRSQKHTLQKSQPLEDSTGGKEC